MLSYAHGVSPQPLLGETIGDNLVRTIARVPDAEALVSHRQGARFTYAEFGEAVDQLAGGLLAAGLKTGDRVGVWSPNRAEWAVIQYATARAGVNLVNINPAYRADELEYAVGQSGCRWIFATQQLKDADFVAMVEHVRPRLPLLERATSSTRPTGRRSPPAPASPATSTATPASSISTIPSTSSTRAAPRASPRARPAPSTTSSTTGTSSVRQLDYSERDRVCIPVPLYHCFGMVLGNLAATSHGACMVYPAETFEPERRLRRAPRSAAPVLYGVPTMFIAELAHERFSEFDLGSLRTGIMAGSPCPIEVMKRVSAQMGIDEMSIAFGMTETSPVTTQVRCDDTLENRCGTVGQALPHVEVKVIDPVPAAVTRGEPGEFCARGYGGHARLLERPRAHGRAIDGNAGCTPVTWRRWTSRATCESSAAARTWSSAAARTSTRARSRSSSTPTRRSPTSR